MQITILIDNSKSWFVPYGLILHKALLDSGHSVAFVHSHEEIQKGDCLFILSCEQVLSEKDLQLNRHNIVIHASKLPEGRGFSPLTWGILQGRNEIWVTVFEATKGTDEGDIYFQENVLFEGHELSDELKDRIGKKIIELAKKFLKVYPEKGIPQSGAPSWYPRRMPKDSELDTTKSIKELFNQLRVADNERYPAFFKLRIGGKEYEYILKIKKKDSI